MNLALVYGVTEKLSEDRGSEGLCCIRKLLFISPFVRERKLIAMGARALETEIMPGDTLSNLQFQEGGKHWGG